MCAGWPFFLQVSPIEPSRAERLFNYVLQTMTGADAGAGAGRQEAERGQGGLQGVEEGHWVYCARALAGLGLLKAGDDVDVPKREEVLEAVDLFQRAHRIYEQVGDERGISDVCFELGVSHCHLGQMQPAVSFLDTCLLLRRKLFGREHPLVQDAEQERAFVEVLILFLVLLLCTTQPSLAN